MACKVIDAMLCFKTKTNRRTRRGHVEDAPHKEHITKTYANHHQPGRKSSH